MISTCRTGDRRKFMNLEMPLSAYHFSARVENTSRLLPTTRSEYPDALEGAKHREPEDGRRIETDSIMARNTQITKTGKMGSRTRSSSLRTSRNNIRKSKFSRPATL